MDRVHPDIRQKVGRIFDQFAAENMKRMAQTIKNLILHTPYAAKFYGNPKIHKVILDRKPLRPIASNVRSPNL